MGILIQLSSGSSASVFLSADLAKLDRRTGGLPPLGYRVQDRRLLIDAEGAEIVRNIFQRYLALGSTLTLLEELYRTGVRTRERRLSTGKTVGGVPFTRGPLNHLLRNRTYIGEINHRDASYPGEHQAILDLATFEAVQARLSQQVQTFHNARSSVAPPLCGKLFDNRGNLMTPTHTLKKGVRYRYYVCRLLIEGRRNEAGGITSVPAPALEDAVAVALRGHINGSASESRFAKLEDADLLVSLLDRVVVFPDRIVISTKESAGNASIEVPWKRPVSRPMREIVFLHANTSKDGRPIKTEIRASAVKAIALGRYWLTELKDNPQLTVEALAQREKRSKRSVQMMLSLNFISPEIIRSLITGKLPRGIGITRLMELPPNWEKQREALELVRT